ncbi:hypothetical protein SAMN04488550_3716 [Gordonia malaquae]|uniref:Condensation domain-containing protein n=1 Tax=Gordonia malaquae NBRC 108250 TaxID=1223542 RepID=M3UUT1_GORML|nr:hypothetical protein [Gordonia malaquae]GAC79217.1 hypothetical protein GM1_007_01760 [Gordonia malaquae NBRC 108250]SEE04194.1 hypothetical protein SAMN04488550_3716 [Gordonia malaquae]
MTGDAAGRLTADDNLFLVMERVVDLPVVNQVVWRLESDVDADLVNRLGDGLRAGRLSRLAVRTAGPTRDLWRFTPDAGVVATSELQVRPGGEGDWARTQLEAPVDSVAGPSWRLTAAPTSDGRVLVSLVFSHVVADGGAILAAVDEAVRGCPRPLDVDGGRPVADALSLSRATVSAARELFRNRGPSAAREPRPTADDVPFTCPTIAVTVDSDLFDATARGADGTPNTLFVALVLGVLERSGRVATGDAVQINLPVSTRGEDDLRSNASSAATADVTVSDDRYDDLSELRASCKAAYVRRERDVDPFVSTVVVAQALPDAVVRRLAAGAGTPLCLASALGDLPSSFATLGGATTGPVAMRSTTVGASAAQLAAAGGGVSAWSSRTPGVVTLCFAGLDPLAIPDRQRITDLVLGELERWDLPAQVWLD